MVSVPLTISWLCDSGPSTPGCTGCGSSDNNGVKTDVVTLFDVAGVRVFHGSVDMVVDN